MPAVHFDRDSMAQWYASRHLKTDPGIAALYYLPKNAPEREIRFVEVNDMIVERENDPLEPIDFGVDTGGANEHKLLVVDVTPDQWRRIERRELSLPTGWTLDGKRLYSPESRRGVPA